MRGKKSADGVDEIMLNIKGLRASPDSARNAALQARAVGRRTVRWGETWAYRDGH
jgi:hypothetical protein